MKKVFYMKTRERTVQDKNNMFIDRIGGLPTHRPEKFPLYFEEIEYGFLMQIYCDRERFPDIEGVLCWQIYQDINEQDDPIIIEVPLGAELNTENEGTSINRLRERIIYYEEGIEPDVLELGIEVYSEEAVEYFSSKIGGAVPEEYIDTEFEYLGCIFENLPEEYELYFGVEALYLVRNRDGEVVLMS
ncbi:hypothetical protein P4V86_15870 [Brevibacillus laterosporus]|uniref:hypothetical protein n=1 Tax=Brevibacillus laterosporus TaxID=1465 RepID=UPI000373310A|nr:hypothetical protein [Brevibacillus laterosporus]ATO50468.1 hypothetical protein BrL25_16025 [Brevibacillus laterosporus DSM 25]MBG9802814.1 hypothetical protein [Brevibacillus laterosporus]MED2004825.1 hypothetical protein [Brevibacillus laterosporus]MED4764312.1 hypothetical protein [Brevibacillus laterosporus]TPH15457.1 hypothetical protein EGH09_12485 [Brevibacillus laterosporus]